ncbi:MAG: glycosyltransferase family 4 protein [Anaerolineaceae bacterium]|nr:glycosyltransferase family 4 protein [Anaerolineaceae bacterium]
MRILLVADGRSPITKNWIRMVGGLGHQLFLLSTYPCEPILDIEGQFTLPVGFSSIAGSQAKSKGQGRPSRIGMLIALFRPVLMRMRTILTPLLMPGYQKQFLRYVQQVQPDIVHALRIPFEGMLAAALPEEIPLIISIWGNDLTLHAKTSKLMALRTREALDHADGLMADAARDIQLAKQMGLRESIPTVIVPGSGGLDLVAVHAAANASFVDKFDIPVNVPLIINPRGFRPGSVHQDVFFQSIPYILEKEPKAYFVCTGMRGQPQAEKWLRRFEITSNVSLLPFIPQDELWALFSISDVYMSLSSHDGTPNSFLEAISCGCFPVVGDIASLQEWIDQGKNGWLVDPRDAHAAADAVVSVLRDKNLREHAAVINRGIVADRANVRKMRKLVENFYRQFE